MEALRHVIFDSAFGRGEQFGAIWRGWPADGAPLHYIAVAATLPPAAALALDGSQGDILRAAWPLALPGMHRLALDGERVTLDLLVGELDDWLPQVAARVNAFVLPQPIAAMRNLARLAAPGATLRVHAPQEGDLKALRSAGFVWENEAAADGWLQALYASRKPQAPRPPRPRREAIVIGAGVAGAAACERLAARGWQVTLVERHGGPAQEASGNHAGIFMPLLSKDDNIPTRLTRAAYLYALRHWQRLGGVSAGGQRAVKGAQCGVLQLARDAEHAALQREVVEHWNYPPEFVRWLDAAAAGSLLGSATPHGAWLFEQSGWAYPTSACKSMLAACGERLRHVFHSEALTLHRVADLWQVRGVSGELLAEAPNVILANGGGARHLAQSAPLPLYTMRGQVTHLAADAFPPLPLVVCREAYMTPAVDGIVCVGATYDGDEERALRDTSQRENLQRAAQILGAERLAPYHLEQVPLQGRVGFRCMAPDRLPLVGQLPDYGAEYRMERLRDVPRHAGLYGLLGYASRGLIWAPLAAELLACQLEDEPLPLEAPLVEALDPARFFLKARRKE
ncbi:FAD-dependent 5-carboxymethylaminomethyl-2-thiouridine(34) oxidoreductase MnmC [Massilia sp. NR 4-1]|uniref:FAD-dependent 5-carboxymethylaminomethyl-2-thiouridine(34) oxidoreductase MnmC n=1 Tax=Massilia sp. NR 4-1 TaxID=1678028 RepID=UPI00067B673B|nr:FAD-dependent 5-carboxymethylaminomethyl-2-thiouridine(34) oxidoreductase MnmC [Massilia sp. NR 4-1]AKU22736.1 tRNA U-34 5-methylaminomethyl-2-thiouridine biosynthesis protein [Massilia sp. NR 4-1]